MTAEELAAIWIDGLTPGCANNALNKLRLADDVKTYSEQEAFTELQSLRDQLAQEDHKAVFILSLQKQLAAKEEELKNVRTGWEVTGKRLFDKEEENLKLREALKELVPIVEKIVADDRRLPFTVKVTIDQAKELLTPNP